MLKENEYITHIVSIGIKNDRKNGIYVMCGARNDNEYFASIVNFHMHERNVYNVIFF